MAKPRVFTRISKRGECNSTATIVITVTVPNHTREDLKIAIAEFEGIAKHLLYEMRDEADVDRDGYYG